jgi:actin-binding protein IPP
MQWMLADVSQRRKLVFEVLAPIRFPLISQKQLETYIESCPDISLKVALRSLVQDFRYDRRLPYELKTGRLKPYLFQPRRSARKNVYIIGGYTRDPGGRWSDSQVGVIFVCFVF